MWQLLDIAYVIPAAVFIGYWLGQYLKNKFGVDDYQTYSIMGFALLGFIMTIVKIKVFVDSVNNKTVDPGEEINLS